jgi:tetratricopeptide (TPR) repeat protein
MARGLPTIVAVLLLAAPQPAIGRRARGEIDIEAWESHISDLKQWTAREPHHANHFLRVAQAYSVVGDTRNVVEWCRMAQERGAHRSRAYLLMGDHYLRMHMFPKAVHSYDRALRSAQRNAQARTKLWRAVYELRRSGATAESVDIPMLAADLAEAGYFFPRSWQDRGPPPTEDPTRAQRLSEVGYRLLKRNDLAGAVRSFHQSLEAEPIFADSFRGLGIAHVRQRRLEQALGAYSMFLALADPDHRDISGIRKIIVDFYQQGTGNRGGR